KALYDQGWVTPRPLAADVASHRPPARPLGAGEVAGAIPGIEGVVTARSALAAALLHNPNLQSFSWEMRVREARALQAGLRPNPEVGIEIENFAGSGATSGFDSAETTALLSQLIPLGGKTTKRRRVAELDRDLAGWDYEAARLDLATKVAVALVGVEAAQRREHLAVDKLEIARQLYAAADQKVLAGAAPPLERTRATVLQETSRIGVRRARQALAAARHDLAATWGAERPVFERVAVDLQRIRPIPAYDVIRARLPQSPRLARWATEISRREAQVDLARAGRVADVTAGAGVRRLEQSDDTAAVVEFSVPLALFDRNQGGILEARYALAKARAQEQVEHLDARTALARAHQELDTAFIEAAALRDTVLPAAQQAFAAVNKSYRAGQSSYLQVLDAQQSFFDARDRYIEALAAYHGAVAAVEGMTGQPLHDSPDENGSGSRQETNGDQP
ncbi:MAG: TolC family protein, partial [Phycisphaerae bacterium]|nr:TolC family protein [Phycisphaerae bacterium]